MPHITLGVIISTLRWGNDLVPHHNLKDTKPRQIFYLYISPCYHWFDVVENIFFIMHVYIYIYWWYLSIYLTSILFGVFDLIFIHGITFELFCISISIYTVLNVYRFTQSRRKYTCYMYMYTWYIFINRCTVYPQTKPIGKYLHCHVKCNFQITRYL